VRLQQQVEELRKHWQKTHEQEHAEYEKQLQRKEQRNQELQMQIGSHASACRSSHRKRTRCSVPTRFRDTTCHPRAQCPHGMILMPVFLAVLLLAPDMPALMEMHTAHTRDARHDEGTAGNNVTAEWAAGLTTLDGSHRSLSSTGQAHVCTRVGLAECCLGAAWRVARPGRNGNQSFNYITFCNY
jgi:hypothetical protein